MKIVAVEAFGLRLENAGSDDYRITSLAVTRVRTDEGVTGYGFVGTDEGLLANRVRPALTGSNPLDVAAYLDAGALKGCPAVEHALWDIAGKVANLPARTLLGSAKERLPYYLTCVWPGEPDQSHIRVEDQAAQIVRYYEMGHTRFKIRGWRPNVMDDVRVVEAVRNSVGDAVEIMIDRTAHHPGWLWTYEQAYEVARGLENANATWLEEPFARDDIAAYRRLKDAVDIPITGGEWAGELANFRDYLVGGAVDIIQPDGCISGGIFPCRKVGVLAEAFGIPCILHGSNGPNLAAFLQAASAIPSCRMMEIALVFPPLTPEEMWEPLRRILKTPTLFALEDGDVVLPQSPGLGVELDEDAVEALRRASA